VNVISVVDCDFVCFSIVSDYGDSVKSIFGGIDLADQGVVALAYALELVVLHIIDFEEAVACDFVEADHNGVRILGIGHEVHHEFKGVERIGHGSSF
jgi:hypothetical protein